jgi:hypothetical protein
MHAPLMSVQATMSRDDSFCRLKVTRAVNAKGGVCGCECECECVSVSDAPPRIRQRKRHPRGCCLGFFPLFAASSWDSYSYFLDVMPTPASHDALLPS